MMSSIIEAHHCKTQFKEEIFYYTWSIDNFLTLYKFGDIALKSSKSKNNFEFYMYLQQDKVEFYGLLKQSKNSGLATRSFYSIFLKTNYGKICQKEFAKCSISEKTLLFNLSISSLINKIDYVPNGTLTIYFEFHTFVDVINSDINYSYRALAITDTDILVPDEMSNQFVTLVVNKEQTLQANKILLCLKSKVFKAMFDCGLKESQTNEIEITDIRYDILKELLSFIVTDNLSNHIKTNAEALCELFIAADKYDIEDLKLICEQNIIKITTIENVVEHLKLAYLNNATVLTKYAKDFIKFYLKDIVDTPSFLTLMQEYPELLIQIINIQLPIMPSCIKYYS